MEAVVEAIRCWISWLAQTAASYIVDGLELILWSLVAVINLFLGLLPVVALDVPQMDSGVVGMLNYVVPMSALLNEFTLIMTAWIIYRIYQWILAWGKVDY